MSSGKPEHSRGHRSTDPASPTLPSINAPRSGQHADGRTSKAVAGSLVDFTLILSLLFGGCCANVWSFEHLMKSDPQMGTTLTFSQMSFITLISLPSFLSWDSHSFLPRLQRRHVPIRRWLWQVLVLTVSSLLNNWAFAFHVPLTVQIVFRSAGLAVSMMLGYVYLKRKYSYPQITAVTVVSLGVILATLSRPASSSSSSASTVDLSTYTIGVLMMTVSLLLSGILGMLQELTYTTYGPYWKEGVFYTHLLSLPVFVFLIPDVKHGFQSLSSQSALSKAAAPSISGVPPWLASLAPYLMLAANLVTQLICVSAVNQLTSRVSSVSTNLVLTARKALSLCLSVWWFGNGWNAQLGLGASMVFAGSLLYTLVGSGSPPRTSSTETTRLDGSSRKGRKSSNTAKARTKARGKKAASSKSKTE
ncbi:UAA-domain-containing protein [Wolfiporia cocos MD-104 SS10]|uniref:UAA-domain-containing protein n=1 Tax=Wolfiporia cocos (strain MD-104) TaxID=742152 RepID=A0A2H3JSE5_WOLCO|nr:UAA-domain-containing protein [Wolfiporia cocos MD-104 SS10]